MLLILRKPLQFFCVAALLTHFAVFAQSSNPAHPIVGTWSWTQFGGKCQETFRFQTDGTMISTSAEAVTVWTYTVTPQASDAGFYGLVSVSKRHNAKKDCSGDLVDHEGTELRFFVQMNPAKDRFISCRTASLDACFGPLGRIE